MLENIRISFQGLWAHKLRSLLTMLGIIIGIAAIIAIVSTIKGSNEQMKKNLVGSGTNTVTVRLTESADWDYEMQYSGIPKDVRVLTEADREKLAELEHVEDASLYRIRTGIDFVFYNNTALQGGRLIGADSHYLNTNGYIMKSGRHFQEKDYVNYRKVALLDDVAASTLFGEERAVGKTIDIKGEPFIVIGVVTEAKESQMVINSVQDYYDFAYDTGSGGLVLVPDVDWDIIMQYDEPQNATVLADSTDNMSSVGKAAADLLNEGNSNNSITYRAKDISDTAEQNAEVSATTNKQLLWIASISLLVGGIGVMNIMLVSVTERTREIGLKKAIGARKNVILAQFLTEAAVLTSLGGIIGTISGIALAEVISKISSIPVAISIPAVVLAIVFSMFIGIIFGFFPSVKAANLDPIVALRHE